MKVCSVDQPCQCRVNNHRFGDILRLHHQGTSTLTIFVSRESFKTSAQETDAFMQYRHTSRAAEPSLGNRASALTEYKSIHNCSCPVTETGPFLRAMLGRCPSRFTHEDRNRSIFQKSFVLFAIL